MCSDFRWGQEIFVFSEKSSLALGPINPRIQWVVGLFCEGKAAGV